MTGSVDNEKRDGATICEVSNNEQPPKSGSVTVAHDWATRRSQSWDCKMEIPGMTVPTWTATMEIPEKNTFLRS